MIVSQSGAFMKNHRTLPVSHLCVSEKIEEYRTPKVSGEEFRLGQKGAGLLSTTDTVISLHGGLQGVSARISLVLKGQFQYVSNKVEVQASQRPFFKSSPIQINCALDWLCVVTWALSQSAGLGTFQEPSSRLRPLHLLHDGSTTPCKIDDPPWTFMTYMCQRVKAWTKENQEWEASFLMKLCHPPKGGMESVLTLCRRESPTWSTITWGYWSSFMYVTSVCIHLLVLSHLLVKAIHPAKSALL